MFVPVVSSETSVALDEDGKVVIGVIVSGVVVSIPVDAGVKVVTFVGEDVMGGEEVCWSE